MTATANSGVAAGADTAVRGSWRPTVAHFRATVGAVVLVAVALIWRRPDLLVIATPMAAVAAWSLLFRPTTPPRFDDRLGASTIREGDATTWTATLSGADYMDFAVAALDDAPWVDRHPYSGVVTALADDGSAKLTIGVRSARWGVRPVERAQVIAVGPWASFRWSLRTARHHLTTLPVPSVFDSASSARPTDGLIGLHRSARPGEGNEFAGIRAFQTGDRMRRINWVRSMRRGSLQVNATLADLDTHVALVLDASEDFGASEGVDGFASSLDTSVRAAGAIAEHFAPRGERVSLRAFGGAVSHLVPPATGQAQLRRILDTLARVRPIDPSQSGHRTRAHDPRGVSGSQLTVMLSPLISPDALDDAVSLGRRGLPVIVIDTLPDHVGTDDDEYTALAWRIRLLERRRELRMVRAAGIPVIRWVGPGSLDHVLRDISRRAAGPRLVMR